MDIAAIIEQIVKTYGVPGIIIAVLLLVIKVLFSKYETAMVALAATGEKIAVAMEKSTKAINDLSELIKDRRP